MVLLCIHIYRELSCSKSCLSLNDSCCIDRTNAGEKCVTVHFHVLVSPDLKFDPKQHKLMIRIGDEKLGDSWKRLDRVMNYEGYV